MAVKKSQTLAPGKTSRLALAAFVSLLLAACTTTQPFVSAAPRQVPLADTMVTLPPGAGALRGVVETVYVNAIEQTVSLDTSSRTPGQNYVKVQYFKTSATSVVPGGLQDVPLANMDMAGEARGTVNYADMKLSPYFVQNFYGPFGYSMGRTAMGDTCMYAWQRIPPPRISTGTEWKTVSVRMLVCASDRTEQQLLDVMMQLRLKGVAGQGRPAPGDIGAYGMIISPFGSGPANVLPDTVAAPAAQPAPRAATVASPAPVADVPGPVPSPSPASSGILIPSPGGTGSTVSPAPIVPSPN